ncbi:MAG: Trk system potassium transporter TrkA [Lachnospiraceae bacterium]|nr:Trk system potassium transporter TrkA [Lachnospiraceae bacterium]
MKILIAGGGKVGSSLIKELSAENHEITLIERRASTIERLCQMYDIMGIEGNCATMRVLRDADTENADLLIAVTDADEINLLCCVAAKQINPDIHTIVRIRNTEYADQVAELQEAFGLSLTVNPELSAAREIERLIRYPGFLKREPFAGGRVELVELRLDENSVLNGVQLKNISSVINTRVLVCAVLRGGKATLPKGDFVLKADDRIFVTAPAAQLTILLRSLGIITHKVRRVILAGGGRISFYLAQMLLKGGLTVNIIDNNPARCDILARDLPGAEISLGDAAFPAVLDREGVADCDAFITLTGLDELNVIISLYAMNQGVPIVITKQSHTDAVREILDKLKLGSVISPKELCSDIIVRYVRAMRDTDGDTAVAVQTVADGRVEACEFILGPAAMHQKTPLKDIKFRPNVLIAAVTHKGTTTIANGLTEFETGDSVVVISSGDRVVSRFNDIFA